MTPDSSRSTHAGQAVYAPATLALYDFVVLRVSNSLIWRCPTANMLDLYNKHATDNHLDVGVGTGWYLDRCRFPTASPRVALMDLNQHSLDAAARRIARYRPEAHRADILAPVNFDVAPFASISLTYLLHCLPGDMASKAAVFDTLAARLRAGGVMFGATLLSEGVERSAVARLDGGLQPQRHLLQHRGRRVRPAFRVGKAVHNGGLQDHRVHRAVRGPR